MFLTVSYFACFFAWVAICSRRLSADWPLPSPLALVACGAGAFAWWRMEQRRDAIGAIGSIALGVHLAAASMVGSIVTFLQTISAEAGAIDWRWFNVNLNTVIASELTPPLATLLPASLVYVNRHFHRSTRAVVCVTLSIIFASLSSVMAIVVVFVGCHASCRAN